MFESMKERKRQRQEEREQRIREEKNRLLSLSEKELLVEILFELKRIENGITIPLQFIVYTQSGTRGGCLYSG